MIGFYEDNSSRKFILIKSGDIFFCFTMLYGVKNNGRRRQTAKELFYSKEKSFKALMDYTLMSVKFASKKFLKIGITTELSKKYWFFNAFF